MVDRTNYLLVREFLSYLREVMQLDAHSVERYWSYLKHLLIWSNEISFRKAATIRPTFTTYVVSMCQPSQASKPIAVLTAKKVIQLAKRLFIWAKTTYPGGFREIPSGWVDALRLPREARPAEEHVFVILEEVLKLTHAPVAPGDLATWRDQAAAAMLFLSGARALALSTLSIECVDVANRVVKQWPTLGVRTKNSKSATTFLLEIPELLQVVERWDEFIRSQLPPSARWYAPINRRWSAQKPSVMPPGVNRGEALLKRIRRLFGIAGIPYKSPHAFRHGHAVFALQHCRTMADYKAVSMNLMHGNINVTDEIYAPLASAEVKQRVAALTGHSIASRSGVDTDNQFADELTDRQLAAALNVAAHRLTS